MKTPAKSTKQLGDIRGQQGFPAVRRVAEKSRGDASPARGGRPHPHPGRLGHLRARRRQRTRCWTSFASTSPPRAGTTSCSTRPAAPAVAAASRSWASWCPAKCRSSIERVDRPAGPRDLHPAHPAGPAGAGPRAGWPGREAGPATKFSFAAARVAAGRADKPFGDVLAEKLRAAGLTAGAGSRDPGKLLRRLRHRPRRANSRTSWSGPTRSSIASRTRPTWTRSSAST